DLGRRDPVAGHVHHVVHAAEQPEITVVVALCPVAGEVHPWVAAPIRLLVALGVAVDPTQHRRPWPLEDEVPAPTQRDGLAVVVDNVRLDAGEWERGTARL